MSFKFLSLLWIFGILSSTANLGGFLPFCLNISVLCSSLTHFLFSLEVLESKHVLWDWSWNNAGCICRKGTLLDQCYFGNKKSRLQRFWELVGTQTIFFLRLEWCWLNYDLSLCVCSVIFAAQRKLYHCYNSENLQASGLLLYPGSVRHSSLFEFESFFRTNCLCLSLHWHTLTTST